MNLNLRGLVPNAWQVVLSSWILVNVTLNVHDMVCCQLWAFDFALSCSNVSNFLKFRHFNVCFTVILIIGPNDFQKKIGLVILNYLSSNLLSAYGARWESLQNRFYWRWESFIECVVVPIKNHFLQCPCWVDTSSISHCDWPKLVLSFKHSCILLTPLLWMSQMVLFDTYKWFRL